MRCNGVDQVEIQGASCKFTVSLANQASFIIIIHHPLLLLLRLLPPLVTAASGDRYLLLNAVVHPAIAIQGPHLGLFCPQLPRFAHLVFRRRLLFRV